MIPQTPEETVHNLPHLAAQLAHDIDKHEPNRKILPEIRDMRRSLTTLESELIDGKIPEHGDAC